MSPKVILRPLERSDLPFLRDLANDPEVRSNVVGWDWPLSLAGQERWFDARVDTLSTRRFIVEDDSQRSVGMTGLWDLDWHNRNALTAMKLGGTEAARGRGLGTAAIHLLMEFAFNDVGLERLYSGILAHNEVSLAAYVRKSGWSEEGRLRGHIWRGGEYVDVIQVGIVRADYLSWARARDQ